MDSKIENGKEARGAGPKGLRVQEPIEQRSPHTQASGGKDFEDYPGSGPLPVGNAPVHSMQDSEKEVQIGVEMESPAGANPGAVPNTGPSRADLDPEARAATTRPGEGRAHR
ncbi:hypothetical protein [Candidatus Nitrospira bockiana]